MVEEGASDRTCPRLTSSRSISSRWRGGVTHPQGPPLQNALPLPSEVGYSSSLSLSLSDLFLWPVGVYMYVCVKKPVVASLMGRDRYMCLIRHSRKSHTCRDPGRCVQNKPATSEDGHGEVLGSHDPRLCDVVKPASFAKPEHVAPAASLLQPRV